MAHPTARTLLTALAVALFAPATSRAQSFDPTTQSILSLMAGPKDGIAYYRLRDSAYALVDARSNAAALPLLLQLTRDYPRDGTNWIRLAQIHMRLGQNSDAIRAWQMAGTILGWSNINARLNQAIIYNALGQKDSALALLRRQVFDDHSITRQSIAELQQFASLRDDPEFRLITGTTRSPSWTRDEGWRADLDYLHSELGRTAPDYRDRPLPAEVTRRYEQLKRDVPTLSDEEIFVGMTRMLAPLRAGHTSLFMPTDTRYLPLRIYAFPDGIYIMEGQGSYANLGGSRITAIGGTPIDTVLRRMALGGNTDGDNEHLWHVYALAQTHYLKGFGAISRVDSVPLTLSSRDGKTRTVVVATTAVPAEGRQDKMSAPQNIAAPLYLRDLDKKFWETALPEHDATYLAFNNVSNNPEETLEAFGKRLGTLLAARTSKNLIIDMRHNNGGNTSLYTELLRTVIAFSRDPGHRVYALIGRRTYSATGNFVTDLERLVRPVWVGEPSSECCNLHGDPTHVVLPYSRIEGELSVFKWNLGNPWDGRREIVPDVPVQLTAQDYFAGRDPVLDTVFKLIH